MGIIDERQILRKQLNPCCVCVATTVKILIKESKYILLAKVLTSLSHLRRVLAWMKCVIFLFVK